MPYGYICLNSEFPRSVLFCIVANVGPHGASRTFAAAYRQGNDSANMLPSHARMDRCITDTLALLEILSDPASRAPLEAEKALAEAWYRRSQDVEDKSKRPSVPDMPQPPYVPYDKCDKWERPKAQPELPRRDDALSEFPFTTTCLSRGLLRNGAHDTDANPHVTNSSSTRPGDVYLQPLSTVFRGDCSEYGLVVVDISDFDSGVKYGIIAFPVRYIADVYYYNEAGGYDAVEDPPPKKEPDIVPISPRPRELLSVLQLLHKYNYHHCMDLEKDSIIFRLEDKPLVDAAALDCTSILSPSALCVY